MIKRTLTGLTLLVTLFGFLFLANLSQFYFDALLFVASAIAIYELYSATKKSAFKPIAIALIAMVLGCYPLAYLFQLEGILIAAVISFVIAFCVFIFDSRCTLKDFACTSLIIIYPYILIGLAFVLNNTYGMIPLLLAIGAAFATDTFAYFMGSIIGGPKIFPKISPKKTYAGCIGGIFGGAIGAMLIYLIFEVLAFPTNIIFTFSAYSNYPLVWYALLGALISVFAEVGDLGASRIKRELNIKDYGHLLGSHGGVMDRIDSLLFATVFMSIFMYIFTL